MSCFTEQDGTIVLNVRVVPRAAKSGIQGLLGDALKIRIQAPPVDGKANGCLVDFLAGHWKLQKRDIELISGETGRNKRLRIRHPSDKMRRELLSIDAG